MMEYGVKKVRRKFDVSKAVIMLLCVLVCFITIYPMYYVLIMSVSDPSRLSATGAAYFDMLPL